MAKRIILDGATGTMLQKAGLGLGERPEIFGMQHPEVVEDIERQYLQAGSNVLYANTFGANRHKLKGTGYTPEQVIKSNIAISRRAVNGKAKIALDIGPIGELMEPLGTLSFEEAYDIYKEMIIAGVQAGADLVVFETMTDLNEVRAAVLAAKENCNLPVWVTMSFEASGRTFAGTDAASMALTLQGLGVDALGVNCSLGPREIFPIVCKIREWTDKPIIVKPNAGLPDPATGEYTMDAAEFARQMQAFLPLGIYIMGGCCGTTPDFIAQLSKLETMDADAQSSIRHGVCCAGKVCELNGVRVIGERINPTGKKRFQQALRERDLNYIMEQAIEQAEAGADILDINVGLPGIDEAAMMTDVVNAVQSVVSLPLQIDSSEPSVIEAGLRACCGKAIVNSVNAEPAKLKEILPLVKKYGAAVVGLTMDSHGIPKTARARFAMAETILREAEKYGIPRQDVLIDCLTLTISAQQDQAKETLEAVKMVHDKLGLHCVLGVSNISFGLPERVNITSSFLSQAMYCGLDLPIINPNQRQIMDTIAAFRAVSGQDINCASYIERFGNMEKETGGPSRIASEMTMERAVLKGLKEEVRTLTEKLLETQTELEVINGALIPALDAVGDSYEKQKIFLPQLINAANAACAGFDLIKERIAERGGDSVSKGTILIATVEGDIHDIGKNIVRVILENYGYKVVDLGRDVPVQKVVDVAIEMNVKLIGLSALMTTTVDSMKRTIEALRRSGHPCRIMVGGAVLTEEYAADIGADYYVADAKASVDVAKKELG